MEISKNKKRKPRSISNNTALHIQKLLREILKKGKLEGGVKMAVWEHAELTSPHNEGICWPLVGDSDAQRDGRGSRMNW